MLYFRRPELTPTQSTLPPVIILAHEGLGLSLYTENEPYPVFRMETYATISKDQSREAGDSILQHINDFLAVFSPAEQVHIYNYFVATKQVMDHLLVGFDMVRQVTDTLTGLTSSLMSQLSFADKAIALVEKTIVLPNLEYVGVAAHYTKDYSFYEQDYYQMTAVSLLCKFMCPVWGEFISRIRQSHIDPVTRREALLIDERNNKELFCAAMILPTLETPPLSFIYHKLYSYLRNGIKQAIKSVIATSSKTQPEIDFVMAKYGYDEKRFEDYVYAMLLVKRIVGFDPWVVDANIVTHANVVINKTATAQLRRMRNETRMMTRNEVSDGGNEPDNVSFTDNMSRISSTTADVPIEVVFGVKWQIPRLLQQNALSVELYTEALSYYTYKLTSPSVFNQAVMASIHARWIGGSALLNYLDFTTYAQLLTYTQLYLLQLGWTQLAAYLTCRTSPTPSATIRPEGQRIRNNVRTTHEYRQMVELYPGTAEKQLAPPGSVIGLRSKRELVEHVNIAGQIERIQTWIIDYDHIAEFAPCLLPTLSAEWQAKIIPDEPLLYDEHIIRELCSFFLSLHHSTSAAA